MNPMYRSFEANPNGNGVSPHLFVAASVTERPGYAPSSLLELGRKRSSRSVQRIHQGFLTMTGVK